MTRPQLDHEPRLPDLGTLPRYADRRQLAALHTQFYGPLSPRTLEVWPLAWRVVNGRAVASVEEFLGEAQRRFDAAPTVRGGRAPALAGDPDR